MSQNEWRQVVQANGVSDLGSDLRVQRAGRGTSLDRKTKEKVWAVFAAYRARLDAEDLSEPKDAYRDARDCAKPSPRCCRTAPSSLEAQDLGMQAFRLIAEIAPKLDGATAPNGIFIVGDAHQRIYGRRAPMAKCGITVRGRSRKLRICYRTSDEIRRFAEAVVHGVPVDDLDEATDDLNGCRSHFHGPEPKVVVVTASNDTPSHEPT